MYAGLEVDARVFSDLAAVATGVRGELEALLEFAEQLARDAGQIALSHFGKDVEGERKRDGSLVTIADRQAEQFMRQRILDRFPEDGIVGEEFGIRSGASNRRWIIDPIDGTFAYARAVPLFGTLIGIEIAGAPCVGVARMPALDETVAAATGCGCRKNGVSARVSATARLEDALLVCGDFHACRDYGFGEAADRLQTASRERRGWGDCYGHLLVATGRADVSLDPVMHIWDCAALAPIIEEAGGTFTDWAGRRTIGGGNAISTNGLLFDDVMRMVRATS